MNRSLCLTMSILCALFVAPLNSHARARPTPIPKPAPRQSARGTARLIVQRAPNFGTDLSIRLLVDGKKVANIPRNQHYGGVLSAGRHTVAALALPNTEARRPTSVALTMKPGKVYIFTAMWSGDRLVLRSSDYYTPTTRANR
jgi:hypothetical protein